MADFFAGFVEGIVIGEVFAPLLLVGFVFALIGVCGTGLDERLLRDDLGH